MAKLCTKISSPQFCLCNRRFATLVPQQSFCNQIAGCRTSNDRHCILQLSFHKDIPASGLWHATCQLPKATSMQIPLRNFLCNSLSHQIFVAFTPTIDLLLVPNSQIFLDLLTSLQLPLRAFSRPSDLYLWTQSPPFILCKTC